MRAEYVSVVPDGILGDVVVQCGADAGVSNTHVKRVPGAPLGSFTVVPDEYRVHYERAHSAFWQMKPGLFEWPKILKDAKWLHATGITAMCGPVASSNWVDHIEAARVGGVNGTSAYSSQWGTSALSEASRPRSHYAYVEPGVEHGYRAADFI